MNYIKSEIYRASHSKGIYLFIAILVILSCLLNAGLRWYGYIEGARLAYTTTSFSFSNLVANPMVFCIMGAVIGFILYDGNRRNGNLKNTIAYGISRKQIFIGECFVSVLVAIIALIIVLTVYIGSAWILLEHAGPVSLNDLLTEVPSVFFIAIAAIISGIVCMEVFDKSSTGTIVWFMIWFVVPEILFYMGKAIDVFDDIAMWMPANFLGTRGMLVNTANSITAWGTVEGIMKCMSTGIIGILLFSFVGIVSLKKKDI